MDISVILSEDSVFPCMEAQTKRRFFEMVAKALSEKQKLDENRVFEALWERENLGSTAYGNGIAVPHARLDGIDKVYAIFVRLSKGIDFDAHDGEDVDMAAIVISPEQSGEDHLQALAAFSSVLRDETARKKIRQAKTAHEIYSVLNQ